MDSLSQDLRIAVRRLLRQPLFSIAAVVALALGIGANTTVFRIVTVLLYEPLPVPEAHRLVALSAARGGTMPMPVSYADYRAYRDLPVFEDAVAVRLELVQMGTDRDAPQRLLANLVSGNFFAALGLLPAEGRLFAAEEGEKPGTYVIVLDHRFWQRELGGDPAVVGTTLHVNGTPFTVIGVTPERFQGTVGLVSTEAYIPVGGIDGLYPDGRRELEDRSAFGFRLIAKLAPGVDLGTARAATAVEAERLAALYPDTNRNVVPYVHPEPMARLEPGAVVFLPPIASVFMTLVALVLLIVCTNVAGLMLARVTASRHELSIRAALGAGRSRLVRLVLVEGLTLGLLGGAVGTALAQGALRLISSVRLATDLPIRFDLALGPRELIFTFLTAAVAGALTAAFPAIHCARRSSIEALAEGGRSAGSHPARHRARSLLVVAQLAVSAVLLIYSALFVRSVGKARDLDLGFRTENRMVLALDAETLRYDRTRARQLFTTLLDRLRSLPGVRSGTETAYLPIDVYSEFARLATQGPEEGRGSDMLLAGFNPIGVDYFETMGMPLLDGRAFTANDREDTPRVAIVNEVLAERLWPAQTPMGRSIYLEGETDQPLEVVGVARTSVYNFQGESPQPYLYVPLAQYHRGTRHIVLHTEGPPLDSLGPARAAVRELDPGLAVFNVKTMEEHILRGKGAVLIRLAATLVSALGIIGGVVAAVGLYGLMAYAVVLRLREFAVRMALGASRGSVLGLVLRRAAVIGGAGVVAGWGIARALGGFFANLLVGVSPTEPLAYIGVSLMLTLVVITAALSPALRAATLDPISTLRVE